MTGNIVTATSSIVSSSNGAEAGVWVIAKTGDFDTFFARIVATDDQGRYLIPGLADAQYEIWTRGYELDDSEKLGVQPGTSIDLDAVVAA